VRVWSCTKLNESGYDEAMYGLSLSHNADISKMPKVASVLAFKGNGHSNFLADIWCWWSIKFPRYWWQEFDRYKFGTNRQSESTIHSITKKEFTQTDFIEEIYTQTIIRLNDLRDEYNVLKNRKDQNPIDSLSIENKMKDVFREIKINLPESYLQTRAVSINYMALQNILNQRKNHKLEEWNDFLGSMLLQVDHPNLICKKEDSDKILKVYEKTYLTH